VALAAIGSTIWQQRRGFRHAREMNDLAAVRSVLDDAALALQHALNVMHKHVNASDDAIVEADAFESSDITRYPPSATTPPVEGSRVITSPVGFPSPDRSRRVGRRRQHKVLSVVARERGVRRSASADGTWILSALGE
jgi:hypothetical protein